MKPRGHTPEQIIRKLREAERMLGEGKTIPEAPRELGISGMKAPAAFAAEWATNDTLPAAA